LPAISQLASPPSDIHPKGIRRTRSDQTRPSLQYLAVMFRPACHCRGGWMDRWPIYPFIQTHINHIWPSSSSIPIPYSSRCPLRERRIDLTRRICHFKPL